MSCCIYTYTLKTKSYYSGTHPLSRNVFFPANQQHDRNPGQTPDRYLIGHDI